jgi:adenosylcobinamide-phosphate synthase
MKVYRALKSGSINEARKAVSMIVGRDTDSLDEEGIVRAAVETVAESASDGIIAPLILWPLAGRRWECFIRQLTLWTQWWDIKTKDIFILRAGRCYF